MGKTWLKRIVYAVLIAELAYVAAFNLVLQLPQTRSYLNQLKPEKFYIDWENAWTLYPFRFHFRNASGNGQSRNQQWEFEVTDVAASIDALPLFFKRIWIDRVRLGDATYRQRPRLKADKDYSKLIGFYPPISGREITAADTAPRNKKRPWHIDIEDIRLDGEYTYWVQLLKGRAHGTLRADLDVVTRGGLFSIRVPQVDLQMERHDFGETAELFRHGAIKGEMAFTPFVPRENKGRKILNYLLIDADLAVGVNNFEFIEPLISRFRELRIDGTGLAQGHLRMEKGKVLAGTDIGVDAENLHVNLVSHDIGGDGALRIAAGPDAGDSLDLRVSFDNMVVGQVGGSPSLLTGQGLVLDVTTGNDLLAAEGGVAGAAKAGLGDKLKQGELQLTIPAAAVADMSVFNHYIPPGAPLSFTSGTAILEADISLGQDEAEGFLRLKATDMQALVDEQSIRADFSADIEVVDGALGDMAMDISGSELRLDNVRVSGEDESFNQKNWATTLKLTKAETVLSNPFRLKAEADLHMTDSRPIVAMLGNQKKSPGWVKKMLTIEDVNGAVVLDFTNPRLVIPSATVDSDKIELGAKAVIDRDLRSGVIYARYKKLDIVVKIADGKRNIDLTKARRKFDAYRLPGEPEQKGSE